MNNYLDIKSKIYDDCKTFEEKFKMLAKSCNW